MVHAGQFCHTSILHAKFHIYTSTLLNKINDKILDLVSFCYYVTVHTADATLSATDAVNYLYMYVNVFQSEEEDL